MPVRQNASRIPGRRAQSKLERQQKLIAAARRLFAEQGFAAATLSEIAAAAGLGKGTIFNYATDKRDLIFLIFHEEMTSLVEEALCGAAGIPQFTDKIVYIAELHYRLFEQNARLSRILLDETLILSEGLQLAKYLALRDKLIGGIAKMVLEGQRNGSVSGVDSPKFIAKQIFSCFAMEVREWASTPNPRWRAGHHHFKRCFGLLMNGAGSALHKQ